MSRALFRIALLSCSLLGASALATVVTGESIETMTRASTLVVRATVERSVATFDQNERQIWTWTELTVTESVKGGRRRTILVKQPGGEVGGVGQHVAGAARFTVGEDCVLFLEPASDEPEVFVVRGFAAGKVRLASRLGRVMAVRDLSGLSFAHAGRREVVQPADDAEVLGPPEAFLARVRAAADGGAK